MCSVTFEGMRKKRTCCLLRTYMYQKEYMKSVQKVSSHIIWKIETFIEEDTRYKKHCIQGSDTLVPFKVGTLGPHPVLPVAMSYFSESHRWSEISSLSKVILVLGKARNCRVPNLGCQGTDSPGWFDVLPKNSVQDMMHEWTHYCDEAANHQLLLAVAFWSSE